MTNPGDVQTLKPKTRRHAGKPGATATSARLSAELASSELSGTLSAQLTGQLNGRVDAQLDSQLNNTLGQRLDASLNGQMPAYLSGPGRSASSHVDSSSARSMPSSAHTDMPPALLQLYARQLGAALPTSAALPVGDTGAPAATAAAAQPIQLVTPSAPNPSETVPARSQTPVTLVTPPTPLTPPLNSREVSPSEGRALTGGGVNSTAASSVPVNLVTPVPLVQPTLEGASTVAIHLDQPAPAAAASAPSAASDTDEREPARAIDLVTSVAPATALAGGELNAQGEAPFAPISETDVDAAPDASATPVDLLAQGDAPAGESTATAPAPAPPTTAGVRSSMAAIRTDVSARTEAIPTPEITAGTEASRRAVVVQEHAETAEVDRIDGVCSSAETAVPNLPADMPESILSQDNPVSGVQALLADVSNLQLPDQSPPDLIRTPGGNLPVLGRRPVAPDTLRQLLELDADTPPVTEEETRQHDELVRMRETMLTVPEVQEGEGVVASLVDIPPPAHPVISEHNRTQISQALARLLANPTGEAQRMIDRARGAAFVSQVLTNDESTSSLGNDTMVEDFASVLGVQFDAIREEAGISAEDMDSEIQTYRETLEEERRQQEEETQTSIDDGSAAVAESNQHVADAVAGARRGMDQQREEVEASNGGESQRRAIEQRRDRLIRDINHHIGQQDANYRRAGDTRGRELDAAEAAQIAAYRYAAQQDEFQLNQNRSQITPAQLATIVIPEGADPVPYYIQVKAAASRAWLEQQLRGVRASFRTLKDNASRITREHRASATTNADTARQEVHTWATTALGEEQSWLDRLIAMVTGWLGQAEASAQAWEEVQNQETVVAASGYVDMLTQVQQAAAAGITEEEMLARSNLTAEERAIIQAYFNPPDGGTARDPIAAVAFGIRERVYQQRASELKTRFESLVLEGNCGVSGEAYVSLLNRIGQAYTADFNAWNRATRLNAAFYPGLTGLGTEEEDVFSALASLNPVQARAVRAAYQELYGESLDSALASEMDTDGERNRAKGLLEGNPATAEAAALHMAMDENFLGTGWGTDRDLIMTTLRNKSPEEIEAIVSAYESTYGGDLRTHLRGELNDWATLSTHDADMADALMDSNPDLADAIGLDQSMHGFTWGFAFNLAYGTNFEASGRDEFTAVTDRIRREVAQEAERNSWTEAQFQAEMRRRLARVESAYDSRYQYSSGSLRSAVDERFDAGPNRDLLNATMDNDEVRADVARVASERYDSVIYASDDVITETLDRRFTRALEAARRDHGPALRREMDTRLDREDRDFFAAHNRYMTGAERYARQQQLDVEMERNLEALARPIAQRDTERMGEVFADEYGSAHGGETLTQAVTASTSGTSGRHALTVLEQGGYLDRYQRFEFAAAGTFEDSNEEGMLAAINGATLEELAEMDARWRESHHGESLRTRAFMGLSGTETMDMTVALKGRPMTLDQAIAAAELRRNLEQPTSMLGGLVAAPERRVLDIQLDDMRRDAERLRRPVTTEADRRTRDRTLGEFAVAQQALQDAVQIHRTRVAAVTDAVANAVSMVVAVAVGALVSFVTAGTATPLAIALIASVAGTMSSIGTRMLLMGNQYGSEEFMNDMIIGVVDAMVAAATAGLGSRLLGVSQITRSAGGPAVRGSIATIQRRLGALLGRLGDIGPLTRRIPASRMLQRWAAGPWYGRLAATVVSESVENAVSALPTAIVGAVIDENNWRGGFQFGNALSGIGMQVGTGVGMGLAMSGGMHVAGRLRAGYRFLRDGPNLGRNTHVSGIEHLPTTEAQVNAARDAYMSQPHPDGSPRSVADFDLALQRERQAHLDRFLAGEKGRTEADFDALLHADAQARGAEFAEMNRSQPDADFDAQSGREAGTRIGEVDAEQRQRQAYREQLNDAVPEGRRGEFGDLPVTVLSGPEFARATGQLSGDARIVMRDGQAHLLVREGASPASVRAEAGRLADMTAAGTGGRARSPVDALPSDLRGRMHIEVDENLPPRSVEVHYESHNGVIVGVWVQVGPGARAADIHLHAGVMRSMRRLQGLSGQVHQLLNRMRLWAGMNAAPMPGTRAFEARLEMDKLPAIINERAAALRSAATPEEQLRLFMEVENLRQQMQEHSRFVNAIEAEPGLGYVAAQDLADGAVANRLSQISDPDVRASIASLPPREQAQFLYQTELINHIANAHADPTARAAAIGQLVDVWRSMHHDFHAADGSLVGRIMGRIAESDNPSAVIGHIETLMAHPGLTPAQYHAVIRDLGYNLSASSMLDHTAAISRLLERNLPGDLTGNLLVSSLGISDRVAYVDAVVRLSDRLGNSALLGALADRLNGASGRPTLGAGLRTDFILGVESMVTRAQSLARKYPDLPHFALLAERLVQGAVDVHSPSHFLGSPPAFQGEGNGFVAEMGRYARSPEAAAARGLNARIDALMADASMAPHLAGFIPPTSPAAGASGSPRSTAEVLGALRESVAHHELGRVAAMVEHLTLRSLADPTGAGVQLRGFMAEVTGLIRHMDPNQLRSMPELLTMYRNLVDRIRDFDRVVNSTHTILPGGRRISDEDYDDLRSGTPTQGVRDTVNLGMIPPYPDIALPGLTVTKSLHADHVVPMDTIARMNNFELLTRAQQLEVLNFSSTAFPILDASGNVIATAHGNFIGLSEAANTSKGPKSFAQWDGHISRGIDVDPEFRAAMMRAEIQIQAQLQIKINDFVRANGGSP